MEITAALLSRIQFAFTISYHIIFPALTIGLSLYLAVMEGLWLKTGQRRYLQQVKFWQKPFAISFGMGVVSGVVLSYQFGANFSRFSEIVGPVLGPLLSYEVLTAFFLEAGFLGIALFGWNRVSPRMHFMATCTVCLGTFLSAFWILAANSWMHTPAGYEIVDGQFRVTDWWQVIFNPSFPYRLSHMLLASCLSASLLIAGISAFYLRQRRHRGFARQGFSSAMWALALLAPLQIVVGDLHGLQVAQHQPVKLAAMEGIWRTESAAPLRLLAWPDAEQQQNRWELSIPYAASLLITHQWDGEIVGLDRVEVADQPPVGVVFWSFRVMLGLGFLMLLQALWGLWSRRRERLFRTPGLLCLAQWMTPAGVVATLAGWYVVEVGRQPWLVQGLVRTEAVVTPLPVAQVALTLSLFVLVYGLLFVAYLHFFAKLIRVGPAAAKSLPTAGSLPLSFNPATAEGY